MWVQYIQHTTLCIQGETPTYIAAWYIYTFRQFRITFPTRRALTQGDVIEQCAKTHLYPRQQLTKGSKFLQGSTNLLHMITQCQPPAYFSSNTSMYTGPSPSLPKHQRVNYCKAVRTESCTVQLGAGAAGGGASCCTATPQGT